MKNIILHIFFGIIIIHFFSCSRSTKKEKFNIKKSDIYILGTIHSNHLIADLEYTLNDLEDRSEEHTSELQSH